MPRTARRLEPPTTRQLVLLANAAVVACCALFTWLHLQPNLILARTTPSGGDMGAHVWGPAFLREHLLPSGRITGWTMDWYSGFPALHFYFPLPSLLIALLSFVLPYGVAFKLVTVLGLVTLPAAAAAFGALAGMRKPYAACLAVATVPFLFDRGWTIYGGNVASTLAGEFSFSISLSFGLLFLGVLARSLDTGKHRGWAAALFACTLLCHLLPAIFVSVAATVMTLITPGVRKLLVSASVAAVGLAITGFWLVPFAARLPYTNDMGWEKVEVYLLPLVGSFSATPTELQAIGQTGLDAGALRVLFLLAVAGSAASFALRRRLGTILTYVAVMAALAFRFMPGPTRLDPDAHGKLWNARMLPFWYLCLYLLAGCLVAELALGAAWLWRRVDRRSSPGAVDDALDQARQAHLLAHLATALRLPSAPAVARAADDLDHRAATALDRAAGVRAVPQILAPAIAAFVVLAWVAAPFGATWLPFRTDSPTYLDDWARWNYVGYEGGGVGPQKLGAKPRRDEYFDVVRTMDRVGRERGCGRAMWEYEKELDAMGTPMALMLLPYWTDSCIGSSEGLYFESSPTTPAHFLTAGSVSKSPSNPQRGLPYTALDLAGTGIQRMQLLGLRYYMAISPEAQAMADADTRLTLVAESGTHQVRYDEGVEERRWKVYEVAGSDLVEPLAHEPVVATGVPKSEPAWKAFAAKGWFADPGRADVLMAESGPRSWARVAAEPLEEGEPDPNEPYRRLGAEAELPRKELGEQPVVSDVELTQTKVAFRVDRVGQPVLVKVSYFPAWKAKGADGPYRVAPNLMVVVPTSTDVELTYGRTGVDWLGEALTLLGIGGAVALGLRTADVGPLGWRPRRRRPDEGDGGAEVADDGEPPAEGATPVEPDADERELVPVGSAAAPERQLEAHQPGERAGDPPGDRGA